SSFLPGGRYSRRCGRREQVPQWERKADVMKPLRGLSLACLTALTGGMAAFSRTPPVAPARHWAYVSPVRPAPAAVRDTSWPRNPIDSFVLARLEKEGL